MVTKGDTKSLVYSSFGVNSGKAGGDLPTVFCYMPAFFNLNPKGLGFRVYGALDPLEAREAPRA